MSSVTHPSLAGRAAEWAVIDTFLSRVAGGGGGLGLTGAPGCGKTVLLDAATAAAADRGMRVFHAAGAELEAELRFATLHHLLSAIEPGFDPACLENGMTVLRRHASDGPMLLAVDDFHWTDPASIAVLTEAAGFTGVLVAVRTGAAVRAGTPAFEHLELRPLDAAGADQLLRAQVPQIAPRVVERLLTEAGGNPQALLELAQSLSQDQLTARRPLPPALSPAGHLHDLYVRRVAGLPGPLRRRLLLVALDGSRAARAASDDQLSAVEAELTTGHGTFQHLPARSAVVRASTGEERAAAHRELAALAAEEPERRAWHLAEATVGADESVAGVLEEAAQRALRRGDGMAAVTALLRAADLTAPGPGKSRRLAEAAYASAHVAGDLRTVPALLNAARQADPTGTGSLPIAVAAAHLLFNDEGDIETAYRLLTATIDATAGRPSGADPLLMEALYLLVDVCFHGGRAELWAVLEETVAQLGPDVPDLLLMYVQALHNPLSMPSFDRMRLDAAIRVLDGEPDPAVIRRTGWIALAFNRVQECREPLLRVVDSGRAGSAVESAINAMTVLAVDDLDTSRWAEADSLCAEALQLCAGSGYSLLSWPLHVVRMILAARRGRDDEVRELAGRVVAWAVPRGARTIAHRCSWAQATAAAGRGDFEEAYHHCTAISAPGVLSPETPGALWASLDLIEAAVRTGRRREAVTHAKALETSGIGAVSPRFALIVLGAAALAADDEDAPELFDRALAVPGADPLSWDRARLQLLYGERLRRSRAAAQARVQLGAALTAFDRLGAAPWAARAARELDATAATRAQASEATVLTPQELQVATLAAAGLTNKQIGERLLVSHRTVGAHLHNVFRKLGVAARGALPDALGADLP